MDHPLALHHRMPFVDLFLRAEIFPAHRHCYLADQRFPRNSAGKRGSYLVERRIYQLDLPFGQLEDILTEFYESVGCFDDMGQGGSG